MKQTKKWQELLKNDYSKLESSSKLKFGLKKIYVSTIASQLYCEKKVEYDIEYELEFGKIESSEVQKAGTQIHDAIIPVEPVSKDELIRKIESEKALTTIFPVFFNYKDVIVSGIHDGIYFEESNPKYLFEIKTTTNTKYLKKVWSGEKFQAILYALALEQMGLNIEDMIIVIPKVSQEFEKESLINQIIKYLDKSNAEYREEFEEKYRDNVVIHKFKLTPLLKGKALRDLRDLLAYWKNEREAQLTSNRNKCLTCMHKKTCDSYRKG